MSSETTKERKMEELNEKFASKLAEYEKQCVRTGSMAALTMAAEVARKHNASPELIAEIEGLLNRVAE